MPILTKPRVLLTLAVVVLFVAVAAGTFVGLSLAFPTDPVPLEVNLCYPEHAIMPEDLDRPDRVVPIPTNCD
jgi:hypothetical protein